jgi:hypothetical protein
VFDERAVTAVPGDHDRDIGIPRDCGIAERLRRHERIVFRGQDQRRHADPVDHTHRAGAVVVISRVAEAVMRRRVRFIELTHGPDTPQGVE